MEDVRRALAGIGADHRARAVPAPRASAHAPARPTVLSRVVPAPRVVPRHAGRPGLDGARAAGPPAAPAVRAVAPVPAVAVVRRGPGGLAATAPHAVSPPAAAAHAPALLRPARRGGGAHAPGRRLAVALRTQRRARVAWTHLSRARLAAAWGAVQRAGGPGDEGLRLVGVYGPLPVSALEAVALEPDGRIAVRLAPGARAGAPGDVALARGGDGRLVRCDLPYPGALRGIRRSR